jgi:hypothetical protein
MRNRTEQVTTKIEGSDFDEEGSDFDDSGDDWKPVEGEVVSFNFLTRIKRQNISFIFCRRESNQKKEESLHPKVQAVLKRGQPQRDPAEHPLRKRKRKVLMKKRKRRTMKKVNRLLLKAERLISCFVFKKNLGGEEEESENEEESEG